jgi:predicted alpha/beta superfamily hydrolase
MKRTSILLLMLTLLVFISGCDDSDTNNTNNINNINNTNNVNNVNNINNINNTNNANNTNNSLSCQTDWSSCDDYLCYTILLSCLESSQSGKDSAISNFIETVESRGGFPIITDTSIVFIYVRNEQFDSEDDSFEEEDFHIDKRNEPITVSGVFNSWSIDATAYELINMGNEFFHVETPLVDDSTLRQSYKFTAHDSLNSVVWFSDPLSRRFDYDDFGRYSLVHGGKGANGNEINHLEMVRDIHATLLDNHRNIYVYLPPGYDNGNSDSYPVLYMHDGNNLFDTAQPYSNGTWDMDGVMGMELTAGNIQKIIIVGISNNANRMDEYTHVEDDISGNSVPDIMGGDGDLYADFIVNDLKPIIDARYRTKTGRESTAVMGSSLGGLISFYIGHLYPQVFKNIGGLSSTFGWGDFGLGNSTMEDLYNSKDILANNQIYYLDSGDNANNPVNPPACPNPATEAEDNYCETVSFRDMLVNKGVNTFPDNADVFPLTPSTINIYHWHEVDAPHNEFAWNQRVFRPLRLFFPITQ